jgi:general secretion pathway protein J
MTRRAPADAGFTLVELMVALAIFGLIAAASVALLSGTVRSQESSQRHFKQMEATGRLATLLGQELAQAGGVQGFSASGKGGAPLIAWTRIGPPLGSERVSLVLENGQLIRRGAGPPEILLSGVRAISIRTRSAGLWSADWSPQRSDTLPDAVELTIDAARQPPLRLAFLVGVQR